MVTMRRRLTGNEWRREAAYTVQIFDDGGMLFAKGDTPDPFGLLEGIDLGGDPEPEWFGLSREQVQALTRMISEWEEATRRENFGAEMGRS